MYIVSITLFVFALVAGWIGYSGMAGDNAALIQGVALVALGAGLVTLMNRLSRGGDVHLPQ